MTGISAARVSAGPSLRQLISDASSSVRNLSQRSLLTMLGTAIGSASIIALLSLGQGAAEESLRSFEVLGSNFAIANLQARPGTTIPVQVNQIDLKIVPGVVEEAPLALMATQIQSGGKAGDATVVGTREAIQHISLWKLSQGRFIFKPIFEWNAMTSIKTFYFPPKAIESPLQGVTQGRLGNTTGVNVASADQDVVVSSLASRLSHASQVFGDRIAGLGRKELAAKVQANIDKILYPLDDAHKVVATLEMPKPSNADSIASAKAATAYVNDRSQPNPFAGLSREQLGVISNDESGAFTVNERRAAFMQAYNEEQAWRSKVVEAAQRELDESGKLTEFFKAAREHFMELPETEQVLYPANYAADLSSKINLDFNYHDSIAGKPSRIAVEDIASFFQSPGDPG